MSRVANDPRQPRGNALLRGVVVVGLLTLAASALQARQGLDWDELDDPVAIEWVRVIAAVVVLLVLWQLARPLLRRLRRRLRRPRPPAPDTDGPPGEKLPLWVRIAAAALVLAALWASWLLVSGLLPEIERVDPATRTEDPTGDAGQPIDVGMSWWPLVIAGAILLAIALAGRLASAHQAAARRGPAGQDDETEEAQLETAVIAAQEELAAHDDPRAAILAAYAAMAAHLTAGLARLPGAGTASTASAARAARMVSTASDTPTELLDRAVRSGLVSPGPATTLTDLFREARFSRHPMGFAQRRAADGALADVRAELVGVRRG